MTNYLSINYRRSVACYEPPSQPPASGQMGSTYHTRHQGPRTKLARAFCIAGLVAALLCLISLITLNE